MFHGKSKISKQSIKGAALVTALAAVSAFAQPAAVPTSGFLACGAEPTGTPDTIPGIDAQGYLTLFDGSMNAANTQPKGLWQSCGTAHSGPSKWKIVDVGGTKTMFSTQDGNKGSVMMTNKKYLHYEVVLDYWPDFGNDGGIFNRTPANGRCFQTVLDYIGGAAIGGTWGENGFTGRDFRPFSFGGNEKAITIPGNSAGEPSNWTTMTQKMKARGEVVPCANASGCTQADWNNLWDFDGWNNIRLRFYGGTGADTRVRMKFWFKKPTATDWVPVSQDTTLMQNIPENYIGFQVHGGGRFGGAGGTWYKNIKVTPLSATGERIWTASTRTLDGRVALSDIKVGDNNLVGKLDLDHEITLKDVRGRTIQTLKGKAGSFSYPFAAGASGWMAMDIKTAKGVEHRSIVRDLQ